MPGCRGSSSEAFCEERGESFHGTCAWGPDALEPFARAHEEKLADDLEDAHGNYNELVLDPDALEAAYPAAIWAVFFFHEESRAHAAEVRDAYVAAYGIPRSDVPLLRLHGGFEWWYDRFWFVSGSEDGDGAFSLDE